MSKKLMKDYPKEIQARVKEIAGLSYDKNDRLSVQFVWDDSKEGQDFWNSIDNGNYDVFYDKYPKEENPIEKLTKLNEDCNWKTFSTNNSGKTFLDEFLNFEGIKGIEVNDPEIVSDSIVDKVVDSFKERSKAGIKKYGVTLDRGDLSPLEWISHLQQELQDAILYAEKLKEDIAEDKETTYPLLKVQRVCIKSPIGNMSFGVNEVSLKYSLDGKTITLDIV